MSKKFQCWIGNHYPKRVTEILYVKSDNEFSNYAAPMAGTICKICGHIGLKELEGHYNWSTLDEINREEAIELTRSQALPKGGEKVTDDEASKD